MSHQIKFNERFSTSDQPFFIGEVIFGTGLKQIEFTDPYGNKSFRSEFEKELYRKHNIVVIGGYQFAFSKLFNIEMDTNSTLRVGDLNDDAPLMKIGVNRASYQSIKYNAETNSSGNASVKSGVNISALNHIFGFMIGDGGSTENNITVVAPDYKRRTLFRAVPFRMSNDGSEINEAHYFGKTSTLPNGNSEVVTSYYIKTFDNPAPHIIHCWASESSKTLSTVDDSVYSSISSTPIESYVEMTMSINAQDARGFFTTTNSIPRINEIGLVSGWFNPIEQDYEDLVLFSHFTRPSILLNDEDEISIIYRLYAR